MINQPWGKRNWFEYSPLDWMSKISQKGGYQKYISSEDNEVFSLNEVTGWRLKKPEMRHYNVKHPNTNSFTSSFEVQELLIHTNVSVGKKEHSFLKFIEPETKEKVDQITPFFDAMKKANLM